MRRCVRVHGEKWSVETIDKIILEDTQVFLDKLQVLKNRSKEGK